METRKFIHVTETVRKQLQKEFEVVKITVWRALYFVNDTETSRKIRERAYELGGILMTVGESAKTLYDHDGFMSQYFPNGSRMLCNLKNSHVTVFDKSGEPVEDYHHVYMNQLPVIQEKARAL